MLPNPDELDTFTELSATLAEALARYIRAQEVYQRVQAHVYDSYYTQPERDKVTQSKEALTNALLECIDTRVKTLVTDALNQWQQQQQHDSEQPAQANVDTEEWLR